jgi:hypothetical protein
VGDPLHQRFEARITSKVIEQRISWEKKQVASVSAGIGVLEPFNGTVLFP